MQVCGLIYHAGQINVLGSIVLDLYFSLLYSNVLFVTIACLNFAYFHNLRDIFGIGNFER